MLEYLHKDAIDTTPFANAMLLHGTYSYEFGLHDVHVPSEPRQPTPISQIKDEEQEDDQSKSK